MELNELKEKIKEYLLKDVGDRIEKVKGGGDKEYNYLSWAWCFHEVMQIDPNFNYRVLENLDGMPYWFDEDLGYMVKTEMTILGITRTMWLPVMDSRNLSMKNRPYDVKTKYNTYKVEQASMFDINKAIMRCLVKNVAMCIGLGLYIYAGEDIPEALEDDKFAKQVKQAEKEDLITYNGITPVKTKQAQKEPIVKDDDLPFNDLKDEVDKFASTAQKFIDLHKEQKNIDVLQELRDMIHSKLYQMGKANEQTFNYFASRYKKRSFDELSEMELRNVLAEVDERLEKSKKEAN